MTFSEAAVLAQKSANHVDTPRIVVRRKDDPDFYFVTTEADWDRYDMATTCEWVERKNPE